MKLSQPYLQLGFATLLDAARDSVLLDALRQTVATVPVEQIDKELAQLASPEALARLAAQGIRGETYFAVPAILSRRPSLLGYYRMLLGYSQKQFYHPTSGLGRFRLMEASNRVSPIAEAMLTELCTTLAESAEALLAGLGNQTKRTGFSNDLCLLTYGAQLRGSFNNTKGSEGIKAIFAVLKAIFEDSTERTDSRTLIVRNAAARTVRIEISADPDVVISVEMGSGEFRTVVAIEVKAGEDQSNIWNRVGEAEKSHLKARESGVTECWTIINVPQASESQLRTASKSTDRFYQLLDLVDPDSIARKDFQARVRSMVGL